MNKILIMTSVIFGITLTACSPIDSTKVFDQHQAEILIKEQYKTRPRANHLSSVKNPRYFVAGNH